MVKEFRTVHLKAIADVVLKISGCDVGHGQNYNPALERNVVSSHDVQKALQMFVKWRRQELS
jgi:hypothetical protein